MADGLCEWEWGPILLFNHILSFTLKPFTTTPVVEGPDATYSTILFAGSDFQTTAVIVIQLLISYSACFQILAASALGYVQSKSR